MYTKSDKLRHIAKRIAIYTAMALAITGAIGIAAVPAQEKFKTGVVTFLSGPGAASFGIPAWNGGKLLIDLLNKGGVLPPPYDRPGFGGMMIETIPVDEAGGTTKQVKEFNNLVQGDKVDAVIGYVSSANCLAISPVADELEAFTILYECGTPRVFEENSYNFVFRSAAHAAMDNISLVKYMVTRGIEANTFAGINQDYSWGQDSWAIFMATMSVLMPKSELNTALFPKLFAGQYETEISALIREKPGVIHSSLWGGDLQDFVLQAGPRGLFKRSQFALVKGEHVMPQLGKKMPEGVIVGARGKNGLAAKANASALTKVLWEAYEKEHGVFPVQAPFRMWQAILGLKSAVEKAMETNGGKKPTADELAAAMKGLQWEAPSGLIQMVPGNGHQAIQPNSIGTTKWDNSTGKMTLVDIEHYAAECVNPPEGTKAIDWTRAGFPGAKCE